VDDEEAIALAVGMLAAAQGAVAGIEEPALRALTKVVQVMPAPLRRRVEALRAVTVPAMWNSAAPIVVPEILIVVALACRDAERLKFFYTTKAGVQSERHVEPHRLVALGRRWYLVAYDLVRHDWRTFRLDRLTRPRALGTQFRPRDLPAADAAAFVRAGITDAPAPFTVEVLVEAPIEQVLERIGQWCTAQQSPDGRCRISMTSDSLDWPAMALGMVNADFEVVSPPELVDHLRSWGELFSRATAR
jgi:predicted DNA-binding transcriptional regulator YafY